LFHANENNHIISDTRAEDAIVMHAPHHIAACYTPMMPQTMVPNTQVVSITVQMMTCKIICTITRKI
ncbi:MAG: hypothetical protein IH795_06015, partial [Bacteroidetes bacterium]|nr:hypothetical protein [Bacteroidota bacterium]